MSEKIQGFDTKRLANIEQELVKEGLISNDQLAVAKVSQKNLGGDLGHILIKKHFVEEAKLIDFVNNILKIPSISLKDVQIEPAAIKLVPQSLALKYKLIPVSLKGDLLVVAFADPLGLFAIDNIRSVVKTNVQPVLAMPGEIEIAINAHYRLGDSFSDVGRGARDYRLC